MINRKKSTIILLIISFTVLFYLDKNHGKSDKIDYKITDIYKNELGNLCWPTQVTQIDNDYYIADYKNNRYVYTKNGNWFQSTLDLQGSHSLVKDMNGNFVIDDTENGRVIVSKTMNKKDIIKILSYSGGEKFNRPHDIAVSDDGFIFIITSDKLIRLNRNYEESGEMKFPPEIWGYARSIKFLKNQLFIINSSKGGVIRIVDFQNRRYEVIKTLAHKRDGPAGSFDTTGPVINDIEYYNGYYYASNYFTKSYSSGQDYNKFRLIRWKKWDDFKNGNFEDVSNLIKNNQVPYFMNVSGDVKSLLLTTFNHEKPCHNESVISITMVH